MTFPDSARSPRLEISPGYAVGVTEAMIETLVRAFYAKVRMDDQLGPVFAAAIPGDWEPHLRKMFDFWSSVTLMSGRFHGTPMQAHARQAAIRAEHFERWLALFEETAREHCPPAAADLFIDRARRIEESLKIGLSISRGELKL